MNILDDEIKGFINSYVDSLLSWDIIIFLYNNSMQASNVSELAKHLGKPHQDVENIFRQLQNQGLVKCCNNHEMNNHKRYEVSHNFQREVKPFVSALNHRRQRLAILAEVLRRSYSF